VESNQGAQQPIGNIFKDSHPLNIKQEGEIFIPTPLDGSI
jgi:hypothetical protein